MPPELELSSVGANLDSLGDRICEESDHVLFLRYIRSKMTLGENHPIVARHLNNLAIMLMKLGLNDKAQKMLQKSITEMENRFPPRLPEYLCALCCLATSYYVVGQKNDGDALLAKCYVYEDAFQEPVLQRNLGAACLASRTRENALVFMDTSEATERDAQIGAPGKPNTKEPLPEAKPAISLSKLFSRSRPKCQVNHLLRTRKGKSPTRDMRLENRRSSDSPKIPLSGASCSQHEAEISGESKAIEAWSVVLKFCKNVARDSFSHDELLRNNARLVGNASASIGPQSEQTVPSRARTIKWLLGPPDEVIHEPGAMPQTLVELPTHYNFESGAELPANAGSIKDSTPSEATQEDNRSTHSNCDAIENVGSERDSVTSDPHDSDERGNPSLDWSLPELPRLRIPVTFSLTRESSVIVHSAKRSSAEKNGSSLYVSSSSEISADEPMTPAEPPVIGIDLPGTSFDTFLSDCGMSGALENPRHGQLEWRNEKIGSMALRPELIPQRLEVKKLDTDPEADGRLQLHANPFESHNQPSCTSKSLPFPLETDSQRLGLRHSIKLDRETPNDFDEHMSDMYPSTLRTDRSSGLYPSRKLTAKIFKRSDSNVPIFLDNVEILLDTGSTEADVVSEDYCKDWGHEIHSLTGEHSRHYVGAGGSPVEVVGTSKIGVRWSGWHGTTSRVREFVVVRDHPQDLSFGNKTISRYGLLNGALMMPLVLASRSQQAREQDRRQTRMIQEAVKKEEVRKTEERLRLWDLNWEGPCASPGHRQDGDPVSASSDESSPTSIASRSMWGSSQGGPQSTLPSSNSSPVECTKKFI